ncbi:MAG: beta-galactosidase trimerization domain-containing protein [Salinibacter sp.]
MTRQNQALRLILFALGGVLLGLQPAGAQSSDPAPRSSAVEMKNGRPTLVINGRPRAPVMYALTANPGGRWAWEGLPQHNIENFCERGVRLFHLPVPVKSIWPEEGEVDVELARKQIAGVQEVCPDASVFFRLRLRAPRWWLRQHPEEWVAYADTGYVAEQAYGLLKSNFDDLQPVRRASMASKKWRADATEMLERFLQKLAETPEGDMLAGIQVANGIHGEWHNWAFLDHEPDVSEPMTQAFHRCLRRTYGSLDALRTTYRDSSLTFEAVSPPGMEARQTRRGLFRDPVRERAVIDYYECMHRVVAEDILHFARVVKEQWPRPIVTGAFYGYFFSLFGRQAAGGHLQLQRVLHSDAMDYLAGPQAYEPQALTLGDPYRSRSLITSVRLHGKLWLDEMDVTGRPRAPMLHHPNYDRRLQKNVANVRRNMAFAYTKGMGLWFYDFGVAGIQRPYKGGSQGTWDHPSVMTDIERMKSIFEARMDEPYRSAADVLFVYDTESFYYTASLQGSDPVSRTLVNYTTLAAFRSGVVFDPIHVDDLDRVDLSQYEVVVFGNTYVLDEEERAFIQDEVARDGRTLVWFYAPGYVNETTSEASAKSISRLTQIDVRPTTLSQVPEVSVSLSSDSTVRYELGDEPIAPLFAVSDKGAKSMGHFVENGKTAVARKRFDDHTAWYVGLPSRKTQPVQRILRESGAHVYSDAGDIVYGGGGVLAVHTEEGGTRTLTLRDGPEITLDLPEGPFTVLLDSETGEVVLKEYPENPPGVKVQYE